MWSHQVPVVGHMSCREIILQRVTVSRLPPCSVTTRCAWWNPTIVTKKLDRSTHEKRRASSTKLDSKPVFELSKVLTKSGLSAARSLAILEVISTVVVPLATEDSIDMLKNKLDDLDGRFNVLALCIIIEAASKPDSFFKQFLSAVLKFVQW